MKRRWKIFLVLFLLIAGMGAATIKSRRNLGQNPTYIDRMIVAVFEPVATFFYGLSARVGDFFHEYVLAIRAAGENKLLRWQIDRLQMENQELHAEMTRIAENHDFADRFRSLRTDFVRARILAFDPFTQSKTILIDLGRRDGVMADDVVMATAGLVGRVIQVFDRASKVLLVIDDDFAVDAVSSRSGSRCLVKGTSSLELAAMRYPFLSQVEYFQNAVEMRAGDLLVTSGASAIYPAGIPVGIISSLSSTDAGLFGRAVVVPSVDFSKLQSVYLLREGYD